MDISIGFQSKLEPRNWLVVLYLVFGLSVPPRLLAQERSSLTLHDAVEMAIHSPRAMVFDAEVEQARGLVRQAGLAPNPKLYLSSEDIEPWRDSFSFANDTEDLGYIGQTIESAGKRSKRVDLAKAKFIQTEATKAVRLRELVGQVSFSYWSAVVQQKVVELLKRDMSAVDEMVEYHRRRVDAGAMKGIDLLRMQIERDRLQVVFKTAQRDAVQSRLLLFKLLGTSASDVPLVDAIEAVPEVSSPDIEFILQRRPEVQAAIAAELASEADLRLQRANATPDPDVFGGYKRNTGDNTLYAGLQLQLPLRNRNQGEITRARAAVTGSKASLAAIQQQVRNDVDQATANYLTQREIVEKTMPDMRERAKQNLEILDKAYRIVGVDLLRYIDARRAEFEVEATALRAMAQLQQSVVELRLAIGDQP